jgi:hypothetical protein
LASTSLVERSSAGGRYPEADDLDYLAAVLHSLAAKQTRLGEVEAADRNWLNPL